MTDPTAIDTAYSAAPEQLRSLHFVGIGGAGMSGIALVLHDQGYEISGSDLKWSRYVELLERAGVQVSIGHKAGNIDHPDVVVISSAIPPHNVELQEARRNGIQVVKRGQALAWIMEAGRGIAVCGTHGKTTTTSMISRALVDAGSDPTFLVGGELNDLGSNARRGQGEFVVCEADESDGSFLLLNPEVVVLTNMELDHHSHYLHIDDVERAFREFLDRLPPEGLLVYCGEDQRVSRLAVGLQGRAVSYGLGDHHDYQARAIEPRHLGSGFEVWARGEQVAQIELAVPGLHNILNALACFASLNELGVPAAEVVASLGTFGGAVRRFQCKGERDGVTVVDDYAHHPTELRATLLAARDGDWKRVIAIFQPHLYSRTEFLHAEFAQALTTADIAVVTDVYGAREDPRPGISGKMIVDSLLRLDPHKPVAYLPRLGAIVDYLDCLTEEGDLVLTLGAGDVHRVGERYLSAE
jgi:UDP-N-acetylmuramate--alanine ligase